MSASSYRELRRHIGHRVEVGFYGFSGSPDSIVVECNDCCEVLLDFDRPEVIDLPKKRKPKRKSLKKKMSKSRG
jgi:hypothetical protein